MTLELPWERIAPERAGIDPLVPVVGADVALLLHAVHLQAWSHLAPNDPQVRLHLVLALVLSLAVGVRCALRAMGRLSSASGTGLSIAACALIARIVFEHAVTAWHGRSLDVDWDREYARQVVGLARVGGLVIFALGLGHAAGETLADLRPSHRTRPRETKRAGEDRLAGP